MTNCKSLSSLLEENRVVVPMLQRDYAQGRAIINQDLPYDKEKNPIRLTSLACAIINFIKKSNDDKTPMLLDFIYGIKRSDRFEPIDGQQRLTTLWLFYWYLSWSLHRDIDKLERFSYETRMTARDFMREMVRNVKSIQKTDVCKGLSQAIRSQHVWFHQIWRQDASINAMLNMLDYIYENLPDKEVNEAMLERLDLIQFHILEMNNIGLDDSLYIKMNARGKSLTPFENFKADILKYIENNEEQRIYDIYSSKLDNDWLDNFWDIAKSEEEIRISVMDWNFFSLINNYLLCDYIAQSRYTQDELSKRIAPGGRFYDILESDDYKGFDIYINNESKLSEDTASEDTLVTTERLENIINLFDKLSTFRQKMSPWSSQDDNNTPWFYKREKNYLNLKQRCLEYAASLFIIRNSARKDSERDILLDFCDWKHFIWSLLIYVDMDKSGILVQWVKYIFKLAEVYKIHEPDFINTLQLGAPINELPNELRGGVKIEQVKAYIRQRVRKDTKCKTDETLLDEIECVFLPWKDGKSQINVGKVSKNWICEILRFTLNKSNDCKLEELEEELREMSNECWQHFDDKFSQNIRLTTDLQQKMKETPVWAIRALLEQGDEYLSDKRTYVDGNNLETAIFNKNDSSIQKLLKIWLYSQGEYTPIYNNVKIPWKRFLAYICEQEPQLYSSKCNKGRVRMRDERLEISQKTQWTVGENGWLTRDMWDAGQVWIERKLRRFIENTKFDLYRPNFLESVTSTRIFREGETDKNNYIAEIKWSGTQYSWYRRDHNEPIKEDDNLDDLDQILKKLIKEDMKEHIDRLNEFWLQQDS